VVDLEVRLDGLPELVARPSELAQGAPESPPQLGKLVGPEHEECDDHEDDELLKADIEHGQAWRNRTRWERASHAFCAPEPTTRMGLALTPTVDVPLLAAAPPPPRGGASGGFSEPPPMKN